LSDSSSSTPTASQTQPEDIYAQLGTIHDKAVELKETLLANLVMLAEIPAPTFSEHERSRFLMDRFSECQLQNCSTDEMSNAVGILVGTDPGENNERNILAVAHTDTVFGPGDDHTIEVRENSAIGAAVGDNSLGAAALATLPTLLDGLGIRLKSNLVLLGATQSLGRGNLEGLNFFLDNVTFPIRAGVCVEGVQLGRLSYESLGMVRGEITVDVPETYDWTQFGASGAINIINQVINRIHQIPLPAQPRTGINIAALKSGRSLNTIPTHAELRYEIRSESAEMVDQVHEQVVNITEELSARTQAAVQLDVFAHREPGGVHYAHPLVRQTSKIMQQLDIKARIRPSNSELSAFILHDIPAITLGITTGQRRNKPNESVDIEPMFTGLTQLVATILAIDEGLCDEH
jgi:tripeptide aminopeptidase